MSHIYLISRLRILKIFLKKLYYPFHYHIFIVMAGTTPTYTILEPLPIRVASAPSPLQFTIYTDAPSPPAPSLSLPTSRPIRNPAGPYITPSGDLRATLDRTAFTDSSEVLEWFPDIECPTIIDDELIETVSSVLGDVAQHDEHILFLAAAVVKYFSLWLAVVEPEEQPLHDLCRNYIRRDLQTALRAAVQGPVISAEAHARHEQEEKRMMLRVLYHCPRLARWTIGSNWEVIRSLANLPVFQTHVQFGTQIRRGFVSLGKHVRDEFVSLQLLPELPLGARARVLELEWAKQEVAVMWLELKAERLVRRVEERERRVLVDMGSRANVMKADPLKVGDGAENVPPSE